METSTAQIGITKAQREACAIDENLCPPISPLCDTYARIGKRALEAASDWFLKAESDWIAYATENTFESVLSEVQNRLAAQAA